jgi:hypothetical protein
MTTAIFRIQQKGVAEPTFRIQQITDGGSAKAAAAQLERDINRNLRVQGIEHPVVVSVWEVSH